MNADKVRQLVTQLVVHGQLHTERTQQVLDFLKEDTSCSIGVLAKITESLLITLVEHAGKKELQRLWVPQIRDIITKLDDVSTSSQGRKRINEEVYGTLDRIINLIEESKSLNTLNGDKSFRNFSRTIRRAVQLLEATAPKPSSQSGKTTRIDIGQLTTSGIIVTDGENVEFQKGNLNDIDKKQIEKLLRNNLSQVHAGSGGKLDRFVELIYTDNRDRPYATHGQQLGNKKKLFLVFRAAQLSGKSKEPIAIGHIVATDPRKYQQISKDGYANKVLKLMDFNNNGGAATADQIISDNMWRPPSEIFQQAHSNAVQSGEEQIRKEKEQNTPLADRIKVRERTKDDIALGKKVDNLRSKVTGKNPDLETDTRIPARVRPIEKAKKDISQTNDPLAGKIKQKDQDEPGEKTGPFGNIDPGPLFGGESPSEPLFGGEGENFEMFGGEQPEGKSEEQPEEKEKEASPEQDIPDTDEDILGPMVEPEKKGEPIPQRDEPEGLGTGPEFDPLTGETEHVPLPPEDELKKQNRKAAETTQSIDISNLGQTTGIHRPVKQKRGAAEKRAEREQVEQAKLAQVATQDDQNYIATALNDVQMFQPTHTGQRLVKHLSGIDKPERLGILLKGLADKFTEYRTAKPGAASIDFSKAVLQPFIDRFAEMIKSGTPNTNEVAVQSFRDLTNVQKPALLGLTASRLLNLFNQFIRKAKLPQMQATEIRDVLYRGAPAPKATPEKKEFTAPSDAVPDEPQPESDTGTEEYELEPSGPSEWPSLGLDEPQEREPSGMVPPSDVVPGEEETEVEPTAPQEPQQELPEELPPEPPIHRGPKVQVLHGQGRNPGEYDLYRLARIRGKVRKNKVTRDQNGKATVVPATDRDGKPIYIDKYVYMAIPRTDSDGNPIITDEQIWEWAKGHYDQYLRTIGKMVGVPPDSEQFRQKLEQVRGNPQSEANKKLQQYTEKYNRNFYTDATQALKAYRTKLATAPEAETESTPMGTANAKVWYLKKNYLGRSGSLKDQVLRALERNAKLRPKETDNRVIDLVLDLEPEQFDELVYQPLYAKFSRAATPDRAKKYYEYLAQTIPDEQFAESIRRFITIGEETGDIEASSSFVRAPSSEEINVVQRIILMNDIAQFLRTKEGLDFLAKVHRQARAVPGAAPEVQTATPAAPKQLTVSTLRSQMKTLETAIQRVIPKRRPKPEEAKAIIGQIQDPKQQSIARGLLMDPRKFSAAIIQARKEVEARIAGEKNPMSYFHTLVQMARAMGSMAPRGGRQAALQAQQATQAPQSTEGPTENLNRLRALYEEAFVTSSIVEQSRMIARGLVESALASSRVVAPTKVLEAFKEYQQTLRHYGVGELALTPISEDINHQLLEIHCLTSDPIDDDGWDQLVEYHLDPDRKIRKLYRQNDDPIGSNIV